MGQRGESWNHGLSNYFEDCNPFPSNPRAPVCILSSVDIPSLWRLQESGPATATCRQAEAWGVDDRWCGRSLWGEKKSKGLGKVLHMFAIFCWSSASVWIWDGSKHIEASALFSAQESISCLSRLQYLGNPASKVLVPYEFYLAFPNSPRTPPMQIGRIGCQNPVRYIQISSIFPNSFHLKSPCFEPLLRLLWGFVLRTQLT